MTQDPDRTLRVSYVELVAPDPEPTPVEPPPVEPTPVEKPEKPKPVRPPPNLGLILAVAFGIAAIVAVTLL